MPNIFISTTSFAKYDDSPLRLLKAGGFDVTRNPYDRKLTAEEITKLAKDAEGIIAGTESLTGEVLRKLKHLKVISRCGVGLDNVDLKEAESLEIEVFNTPFAPTSAVAELAVGLILNLLRKVTRMNAAVKDGIWDKQMGNLLHGKKTGIIGFGRIGQKTGELLSAFGAELAYCDREPKTFSIDCKQMKFRDILEWADILTLHLDVSNTCGYMIGEKELKMMKKGSWLINLSRGGVVDEQALFVAIKSGHLQGAALDVFEREPYNGPLIELDNVILTPHIGSYAKESRIRMEIEAAENLIKAFKEHRSRKEGHGQR
ncbi:MAG: phosphoglycerate dehydrogenase [Candidatus Omnitrophica bacterium]|nr:phosphoglycerate dehydrogenase [Candidatus Omnitrophota bacterium]MBU4488973.1 phosphoglycerate dehydrogenase [Candidatus Omnitrophota bacterium]